MMVSTIFGLISARFVGGGFRNHMYPKPTTITTVDTTTTVYSTNCTDI